MKKLTKGALAMVLAGSVTFSVTNALLATPPAKQLKEKIVSTISGDRKADVNKEKMVENPTLPTNIKDKQAKLSQSNTDVQVALNNKNKNNRSIAAIQQNTNESRVNPAKANGTATTAPAAPPIGATRTNAPTPPTPTTPKNTSTTPTSSTTSTTTGASTPSATTAPSDYGQQVSQTAKEKGKSRQENKEKNGKKL